MGSSNLVYGKDMNQSIESSDLVEIENSQFNDFIKQIQEIKNENPGLSEDDIVNKIEEDLCIQSRGTNNSFEIWGALTSSEKKLVIRYPFAALDVNKAKNIAVNKTLEKFGTNGLGDRSDAFRHGMWNAVMTGLIGRDKAELFATAHEDKAVDGEEADGYAKILHKQMDLHNNEIGREIGYANPSDEHKLADIIYENILGEDTLFKWLHE